MIPYGIPLGIQCKTENARGYKKVGRNGGDLRTGQPPAPIDLVEMESGEALPRTYKREEPVSYLEYCRQECQETIVTLSNEEAVQQQIGLVLQSQANVAI